MVYRPCSVSSGFDAVDVVAHINLVDHGVFVGIFRHQILVEKSQWSFWLACCSETNKKGIEVFEHLSPEVINRAVAFVDDDQVESFDWNGFVIIDFTWFWLRL